MNRGAIASGVAEKPGGWLWTEFARNDAVLLRCLPKSSARSPARAAARRMKKARRTSGRPTRRAMPDARAARLAAAVADVFLFLRQEMGIVWPGLLLPARRPAARTTDSSRGTTRLDSPV